MGEDNVKRLHGLIKLTASVSLACGIAAAVASPALAASPNEAYGAAATGVITVAPVGLATYPSTLTTPSSVTVANADIAGLLTTGVVTDTATATSASSTIANPRAGLTALVRLTATAVTSRCSLDTSTGTVSGSASIARGRINAVVPIALAANPAPNTGITVPGIATITLNRQTVDPSDGTLTVDAVFIKLLGSTQTLTLATSVCNAASLAPAPALPGMALPIGAGLAGLLGLGGVGYFLSRRRRIAAQSA